MKIFAPRVATLVKLIVIFFSLAGSHWLFAQIPTNGLDVIHYALNIALNDTSDMIHGNAQITTSFTKGVNEVRFDLAEKSMDGKGMTVLSVTRDSKSLPFSQDPQHLIIEDAATPGSVHSYSIRYEGIPSDGLIISKTKFGQRSFFSDNWPNRAHYWFPCNDHLSDKATVEFMVTAPDHYQVVSNGRKVEETNLPGNLTYTHWIEEVPLPTKIMVIGVTAFAVEYVGNQEGIPLSTWVYPEDRENGFKRYAMAKAILKWYISHVGPYGYEKLANVQSRTMFGGVENAGAIFYNENSVQDPLLEGLMAHEIAHQWFGDNVTEKDWPHVWLSEGFATYMTDLYLEGKYGRDTLQTLLKEQRKKVIAYYEDHKTPVVDTTKANNLMGLLNKNSYEKGGWVLHMLRQRLGDSLFWKGIRSYYSTYAGRNANTADLEKSFEIISGKNLKVFFRQWLFNTGQPELTIKWRYDSKEKAVKLNILQSQPDLFDFPLEINFSDGNKIITRTILIKERNTQASIPISIRPVEIRVDPNTNLLFVLKGVLKQE